MKNGSLTRAEVMWVRFVPSLEIVRFVVATPRVPEGQVRWGEFPLPPSTSVHVASVPMLVSHR